MRISWKAALVAGLLLIAVVCYGSYRIATASAARETRLHFAPGFSEQKFRHVQLGMTKQQVRRLLGKPIGESLNAPATPHKNPEIWYYSSTGGSDPVPERQHFVEFDRRGKVIGLAWPWR